MTRFEEETHVAITRNLPKINDALQGIFEQLKIANKLKALELKAKFHGRIDDGIIDATVTGEM